MESHFLSLGLANSLKRLRLSTPLPFAFIGVPCFLNPTPLARTPGLFGIERPHEDLEAEPAAIVRRRFMGLPSISSAKSSFSLSSALARLTLRLCVSEPELGSERLRFLLLSPCGILGTWISLEPEMGANADESLARTLRIVGVVVV